MNYKKITLTFYIEQVCKDLLVQCNLVSKSVREAALADLKSDLQTPDGDETRSLICRAVTEAFGQLKYAAQRYLTSGRTVDENVLERLAYQLDAAEVPHLADMLFEWKEDPTGIWDGTGTRQDFDDNYFTNIRNYLVLYPDKAYELFERHNALDKLIHWEDVVFSLRIPNFNVSVTDALKSWMHKYVVDYTMWRFLQDQLPERAGTYKTLAETDDYPRVTDCLNSRENFTMRTPSFI